VPDFLEQLNPEQKAAASTVTGPVVIHAGAGTGKTRVITQRAAHAAATDAMDPAKALMLTFTRKAADEMRARLARLGYPQIQAATFHAAARKQLDYFWPQLHGEKLRLLDSAWPLVSPLVRRLPGHYKFTPTQDVIDLISWAQTRRIDPIRLQGAAAAEGRMLPLPEDLLRRVMSDYQSAKRQRAVVDFDDLILLTTDLLRENPAVAEQVRDRYRWFCVDEYQDTNPANDDLLREWLGPRDDLCVVGDAEQTIFAFAGASASYLENFTQTWPDAHTFQLLQSYRSTMKVLALANRLSQSTVGLVPARPSQGATAESLDPEAAVLELATGEAEMGAMVGQLRAWVAAGVELSEMAVLVRFNADLAPIEAALAKANIPYRVKGTAFYARQTVRKAIALLEQELPMDAEPLIDSYSTQLVGRLGFDPDAEPSTNQAREEHAILQAVLDLVTELARATKIEPQESLAQAIGSELTHRAQQEGSGVGVELATLHKAKGLEWDAVFLPMLEEGRLPAAQSTKRPDLVAEERRLLYVGITRARRHLALSWAHERSGGGKGSGARKPSRFLQEIGEPGKAKARTQKATPGTAKTPGARRSKAEAVAKVSEQDRPLFLALKEWRLQESQERNLPAYVIFHDRTLAEFATQRPRTAADLLQVAGVGPVKVETYGQPVLKLVAEVGTP
jgi:DNA helicase-2/ATP-dependent DNA helicase PcrA